MSIASVNPAQINKEETIHEKRQSFITDNILSSSEAPYMSNKFINSPVKEEK